MPNRKNFDVEGARAQRARNVESLPEPLRTQVREKSVAVLARIRKEREADVHGFECFLDSCQNAKTILIGGSWDESQAVEALNSIDNSLVANPRAVRIAVADKFSEAVKTAAASISKKSASPKTETKTETKSARAVKKKKPARVKAAKKRAVKRVVVGKPKRKRVTAKRK